VFCSILHWSLRVLPFAWSSVTLCFGLIGAKSPLDSYSLQMWAQ
jgi:hypothetical protein